MSHRLQRCLGVGNCAGHRIEMVDHVLVAAVAHLDAGPLKRVGIGFGLVAKRHRGRRVGGNTSSIPIIDEIARKKPTICAAFSRS